MGTRIPDFTVGLQNDEDALKNMFDKTSDSPFLNPRETARVFGVTTRTILNWKNKDKLKCMELPGNTNRYYKEDVARVMGFEVLAKSMRSAYKDMVGKLCIKEWL
jgi:hypothetical protein